MSEEHAALLEPYILEMDFDYDYKKGSKLASAGYGYAANPERKLTLVEDSDCVVYDETFKYISDADPVNPEEYNAWSFVHGCDSSHGDSGSPIVDRASGLVVGIIWTGKAPKSASAQSSDFLKSNF